MRPCTPRAAKRPSPRAWGTQKPDTSHRSQSSAQAVERARSDGKTAPSHQQPGLDDEIHPAGGGVERKHDQHRVADRGRGDEGDTEEDGHPTREQHRPLPPEQRAAAQGDDELRRTGEGGPHPEDDEHRRDALARGDAEGPTTPGKMT